MLLFYQWKGHIVQHHQGQDTRVSDTISYFITEYLLAGTTSSPKMVIIEELSL